MSANTDTSESDDYDDPVPAYERGPLGRLKYSIGSLLSLHGSTGNILKGIAINGLLGLVGVAVMLSTQGFLSYLGGFWAILNFGGILAWVIGL